MKQIQIVKKSNKEVFRMIFNKYLTELSQFDEKIKFDKKGNPIYKWFDCYWTDAGRFPLFMKQDDEIVGIALIREIDESGYEIGEFYILPDHRKNGNAYWFACEITKLFSGYIEISTMSKNNNAVSFWDKFTSNFKRVETEEDGLYKHWKIIKEN